MSIIKNGCICGGDYYTNTEQCNDIDCNSERKTKSKPFPMDSVAFGKIDFALSFFIGGEHIDDILELEDEEAIQHYLINKEYQK